MKYIISLCLSLLCADFCTANEVYKELIRTIYCPTCQGQVLDESNHPVAVQIKREIQTMLQQGQTPRQIKEFYKLKYGEKILLEPSVSKHTWILWAMPFLLVLGTGILVRNRFAFHPR